MNKEFSALYGSLTKEGRERLVNTLISFASAEDIIDGMYKQAETEVGAGIRSTLKKKASAKIDDAFFKHAKMTIPTPDEARKESAPKQEDDRPEITCESCAYEGKTDARGQCPECGVIMGVKPSDYPIPYTPIWTGEPMSGISVNEANTRGKMEEVW